MVQELIDRIYECSFAPDMWPEVLDDLSHLAEAQGGVLFAARERVSRWTASPAICEHVENFMRGDWISNCTRGGRLFSRRHPGSSHRRRCLYGGRARARPCTLASSCGRGGSASARRPRFLCRRATRASSAWSARTTAGLSNRRSSASSTSCGRIWPAPPFSRRACSSNARGSPARLSRSFGLPALVLDDYGRVISANDPSNSLGEYVRRRAGRMTACPCAIRRRTR